MVQLHNCQLLTHLFANSHYFILDQPLCECMHLLVN